MSVFQEKMMFTPWVVVLQTLQYMVLLYIMLACEFRTVCRSGRKLFKYNYDITQFCQNIKL